MSFHPAIHRELDKQLHTALDAEIQGARRLEWKEDEPRDRRVRISRSNSAPSPQTRPGTAPT